MKSIFAIFFALTVLNVKAQDAKVTTGTIAYQQQDFKTAITNFEIALSDVNKLKSKYVPKAYYYYAKSLEGRYNEAVRDKDIEKVDQYTKDWQTVFDAYSKCLASDSDNKYRKKVNSEYSRLHAFMLQNGLHYLNSAYSRSLTTEEKKKLYEQAIMFTNLATVCKPDDYMAYDLCAQAQLQLGDSTKALKNFENAIRLFGDSKPSRPDQLIAYVYYRAALIYRYDKNDLNKALMNIEKGKVMIKGENNRLKSWTRYSELTDQQKAQLEQQYKDAFADLGAFELDIYLNYPEKKKEAIQKFEQAVKSDPNNYVKHIAYASLMEKEDPNKAVELYKKAIAIDKNEFHAHFNLGALYNNIAKEWYDKANDSEDMNQSTKYQTTADKYFQEAYIHFENAYAIDSKDLSCIRALKQIAIRLNKMEEYQKYKAAEKENSSY